MRLTARVLRGLMRQRPETKPRVNGYSDLMVWQRAMDLVIAAYQLTKTFPADERYALVQQVRRADGRGRENALRTSAASSGALP